MVWKMIAEWKRRMNITESLDGDEVDVLCEDIKDIINRNEGNKEVKCICEVCLNGTRNCYDHGKIAN